MRTPPSFKRMTAILRHGLLWFLQIAIAFSATWLAMLRFFSEFGMDETFNSLGLGQWLRNVTGSLELIGAIALLFPQFCALGAILLISVWTVIILASIFIVGTLPFAIMPLMLAVIVAWKRRDRLPSIWGGTYQWPESSASTVWWHVGLHYFVPIGLAVIMIGSQIYVFQASVSGRYGIEGLNALQRGDNQAAITAFTKALSKAEQLPLSEYRVVESLIQLGAAYGRAHQISQAETTYRRAIQISQDSLSPHDPLYYQSVHGLASALGAQARYPEAESLYLQTVARASLSLPQSSIKHKVARVYLLLSNPAREMGAPEIANELEKSAKDLVDHGLTEQVMGLPDVLDGLANLYSDQGQIRKAEEYYKRALTLKGQILGGDFPDIGDRLLSTGLVTDDSGKPLEGFAVYMKVQPLLGHISYENQEHLASSLNSIAETYRQQQRDREAESLYQMAVAIIGSIKRVNTPSYVTMLTNWGLLYNSQGRYAEAEPRLLKALAIRERSISSDYAGLAHSYNNLALLYDNQDQYAKAEPFYRKALDLRYKVLGPTHSKTVLTTRLLANLYFRHAKYAEAEPLYRQLIQIQEQELGIGHPTILNLKWKLAGICSEQGKYQDAIFLYERIMPYMEERLNPDSPMFSQFLSSYAHVLELAQKTKEAEQIRARIRALDSGGTPTPPVPSQKHRKST